MTVIGVGTAKGAFFVRSSDRTTWDLSDPVLKGWQVTTFGRSPAGDHLLATGSNWFGAAIHRSRDLEDWQQIVDGPAWPEGGDRRLNAIWAIVAAGDALFAGVDEAGLFRSDDDGASWRPLDGFNEHETRPDWSPGFGGLATHRVLVDPAHPSRLWSGTSAVGVFRSEDGGITWHPRNRGVRRAQPGEEQGDIGFCVHSLVADPADADTIWRQDHTGVYRTTDGGDAWEPCESGLPTSFGFPIVRDDASGDLFVVPLESDEHRMPSGGAFEVYRSRDRGDSWQVAGRAYQGPLYAGVLRDAAASDGRGGVYLGTTAGTVHVSVDGGSRWTTLPFVLPRILTVHVLEP